MRTQSVYLILCLCGENIESHQPETICPKCGRLLIVKDWGQAIKRLSRYFEAVMLTLKLWSPPFHPRYDPEEPFDSITLKTAWSVAKGIWLDP